MPRHPIFCPQCSTRFVESATWPKVCSACPHREWGNPLPVVVILCPVLGQMLLQRRNINPARGQLALPAGYVNPGESPQEASARELREETERHCPRTGDLLLPGLDLPLDAFRICDTAGLPRDNLVLLFHRVEGCEAEAHIATWWERVKPQLDRQERETIWNEEVQTLQRLAAEDLEQVPIAFTSHRDLMAQWFGKHT